MKIELQRVAKILLTNKNDPLFKNEIEYRIYVCSSITLLNAYVCIKKLDFGQVEDTFILYK